jgi:hypothetical protein
MMKHPSTKSVTCRRNAAFVLTDMERNRVNREESRFGEGYVRFEAAHGVSKMMCVLKLIQISVIWVC